MAENQAKTGGDVKTSNGTTINQEEDEKNISLRNLKLFVSLFLKQVESKLNDYKKEFSSGKYKDGRIARLFPAASQVAIGTGKLAGFGSEMKALQSASTAVLAAIKVADSSQKRKKLKKILWLLYMEEIWTNCLKRILVFVACDIYQSFECQMNTFTADGGYIRALEKVSEEARDRMINYFVEYPIGDEEELSENEVVEIMIKGIILGESKRYSVAGVTSGLTHSGHTLENKHSVEKVNCGKMFSNVGLVEFNEKGNTSFKHVPMQSLGECKTRKYGYRKVFQFVKDELEEVELEGETELCKGNPFREYAYQLCLNTPEKLRELARNISDTILQSTPEVMAQKVKEISIDTKHAVSLLEELRKRKKEIDLEKEKLSKEREKNYQERQRYFHEIKRLNEQELANKKAIKEMEEKVVMLEQQLTTLHGKQTENIWNVGKCVETFTGRAQELEKLHGLVVNRPGRFVVVHGLGGVGKTELVRKYAENYRRCYHGNCLWVNAATTTTLTHSFHYIATQLNISLGTDHCELIAMKVFKYFATTPCLFIFDNVRESAEVCEFISKLPPEIQVYSILIPKGNVLTRRNSCYEVVPFTERDAIEFIKTSLNIQEIDKPEMNMIEGLVKSLDHLPLALQQAVDYILEECDGASPFPMIKRYLNLLERDPSRVLASAEEEEYSESVLTTWDITFERVQKSRHSGLLASQILDVLSYFDNDMVPVKLLLSMKGCNATSEDVWQALKVLKKHSVIRMFEDEDKTINMHSLMQIVLRQKHKVKGDSKRILCVALETLKVYLKEDKRRVGHSLPGLQALCHAEEAWKRAADYKDAKRENLEVLELVISTLMAYRRYSAALPYIDEYMDWIRQVHPSEILKILETQLLQAKAILLKSWQDEEDLVENPIQRYTSLLETYKAKVEDDTKFLHYWYDLACILHQIGLTERATQEYQSVLSEQRLKLGSKHSDTLLTQQCLASAFHDLGQYEEALFELRTVLETQLQMEHSASLEADVLTTETQIALAKRGLGMKQEALQELLLIWEKRCEILGKGHHDTVTTTTHVISVIDDINNHRKPIEENISKLKKNDQNLAQANAFCKQLEKAAAFCSLNDEDNTLSTLNEVLEKQKILYGDGHEEVLKTKKIKAKVLSTYGRNNEALEILEEICSVLKEQPQEFSADLDDAKLTISLIKANLNIKSQHARV